MADNEQQPAVPPVDDWEDVEADDWEDVGDWQDVAAAEEPPPPPIDRGFDEGGNAGYQQITDEQQRHRLRLLAEIGVPLAAGLALGPQAGWGARLAIMSAMGGVGSGAGLVAEPPEDAADAAKRVGTGTLFGGLGEGLGLAAGAGARAAGPPLLRFAENQGLRGLGFMQSNLRRMGGDFLNSGREVARTALDRGVLSPLANSETMAARALALGDEAGGEVGRVRDIIDASGGARVDAGRVTGEVDQTLNNWRPGRSDEAVLNRHLGDTLQDVFAHSDSQATLGARDLGDLKQLLASRAKYHRAPNPNAAGADLAGQSDLARGVAQGFEEAHAASNLTLEQFEQFMRDKRLHGQMQELINPEYGSLIARTARDAGNSQVGMIPGMAAATTGHPLGALARLVAARTISQRGNQVAAVGANNLGNMLVTPEMRMAILTALQAGTQAAAPRSRMEGLGLAEPIDR